MIKNHPLILIFSHMIPPSLVVYILIVSIGFFKPIFPHYTTNATRMVINTQIYRAQTMPEADILILGDSAARFGLNSRMLSELLPGCHFESLATNGYSSPTSYADLFKIYKTHHQNNPYIWLVMNKSSITITEEKYKNTNLEFYVREQLFASPWVYGRNFYFFLLSHYLINWPAQKSNHNANLWGIVKSLLTENGTHPNPRSSIYLDVRKKKNFEPYLDFTLSQSTINRLEYFSSFVQKEQFQPPLFFSLMPNPEHLYTIT